jgi:polysaccharide export outer membrane protein
VSPKPWHAFPRCLLPKKQRTMHRNRINSAALTLVCFVAFVLILTSSCSTSKNLNYFNDLPNTDSYELKPMPAQQRIIERGDRLDIAFIVRDQESAAFFNKHNMATAATAAGVGISAGPANPDYLVDADGEVEIPVIGKVKLAGLTTSQAKEKLTGLVNPFLKDPLVEVNFSTFKVTVLGEVKSPGSYVISAQHATLFEALAAAGDLPHTAKRYNVSLYRDYNGKRTISKFDLRKMYVLNDPDIFQMRPNDVIYVQARPGAVFKEDAGLVVELFTILFSAATLGFTIHNSTK